MMGKWQRIWFVLGTNKVVMILVRYVYLKDRSFNFGFFCGGGGGVYVLLPGLEKYVHMKKKTDSRWKLQGYIFLFCVSHGKMVVDINLLK
jgi:hypothetical protein